jgi:hypothetical protein
MAFYYEPAGKLNPPKAYRYYSSFVTKEPQLALGYIKLGIYSHLRVTMLSLTVDPVLSLGLTLPPIT